MMKLLEAFWRWFSPGSAETPSASGVLRQEARPERDPQPAGKPPQGTGRNKPLPTGIRVRREKVHLQVGVDFGTSTTKVAFQQVGGGVRQVRALSFGHKLPHYPEYCIPSVAAFDNQGQFLLGPDAARFLTDKPSTDGLRFLKLVLAGQYDRLFLDPFVNELFMSNLHRRYPSSTGISIDHVVVSFLATTLHKIRSVLKSRYPNQELELAFNVCAPIDHIENNPLKSQFDRILQAAELLESNLDATGTETDLLERSCVAYAAAQQQKPSTERRVFLIPESVGAIASYLASLQVRNGTHAVYDFGAGTTDVSIFEISNVGKGDPFTYWRSARNLPRGAQRIERLVADFLNAQSPSNRLSDIEVSRAVVDLQKQPNVLREKVRSELTDLWKDCHVAWREAYGRLKTQSEWEREKVQVFVCGGGSGLPLIKEIFAQSWMPNWGPYPTRDLPGPDVYDADNANAPFRRLCVAYGLTTPQPQLGEYVLPRDCPDHTPKKTIRMTKPRYGIDMPDT
jgi:hypothetical protein